MLRRGEGALIAVLVVKVEIWPGGSADRGFEIARLGLGNRSGLAQVSNYGVTALMGRDGAEHVMQTMVMGHNREHGWVPLVRRALSELNSHNDVKAPLDDPIAELLRRDGHVRQG